MTPAQKLIIALTLLFVLLTLTNAVPAAAPDLVGSASNMLETTPVDIADLPANYNATITAEDPNAETWVYCETSMGSPWLSNARVAIGYLYNLPNRDCCQGNPFGSKCSRLVLYGNADIAICGSEFGCLKCGYVAYLAEVLTRDCANWDRVGGTHYVHQGVRIIIY